ncbi:MAG TPA: hypothetical protein VLM85_30675 [Polyangiaceae bacterium]|nr:hypothetical protein [Polyangiaceae bacterium]
MRGVTVWVGVGALLVLAACGARSQIAGGGEGSPFGDAGADVFGHLDGAAQVDGSGKGGGADAAGACIVSVVSVGCAGPNGGDCGQYGCKFDVEWKCGDTTYRAGGACAPPGVGPTGGTYQGVCDENGSKTSSFDVTTTTCDCKDEHALATLVQGLCTHQ